MTEQDLDAVLAIERQVQPDPWTRGHFMDSLRGGHRVQLLRETGALKAYVVVMDLPDEAELLNIAVAPQWQRQGLGCAMLRRACDDAAHSGKLRMFLEVRRSNAAARALYEREAFAEIGMRKEYYSLPDGRREDAILMAKDL